MVVNITPKMEQEAAQAHEQRLYALAIGLSEMHNLKYGQLMAAAKVLEEERKDKNEHVIHQLECNLGDVAVEYAKAKAKMLTAWRKHGKASREAFTK